MGSVALNKLYLIAGEDSGDLHGSKFIAALRQKCPDLEIRGIGGDQLSSQGMDLIAHIRDTNFMGFWEVLKNLKTIRKLFKQVREDIKQWNPDAIVLIDYPGFNLRLLPFLKALQIPIIYYISPQVWAWKKGRVKKIARYVDKMMVILPFEQDFYAKEGISVDFVGHPLLDSIPALDQQNQNNPKKFVALLPGSRKQEIRRMLPTMLEMADRFPDLDFVIAGAPSQKKEFYQDIMGSSRVQLKMNQTYALLQEADYALVTSGTATLETALFRVPQVVCYRGNAMSYHIGKRLIQVSYISLVNLILDRPLITELIQYDFNSNRLEQELKELMQKERRNQIEEGYAVLIEKLGQKGASQRAAALVNQMFTPTQSPSIKE